LLNRQGAMTTRSASAAASPTGSGAEATLTNL
jgi:hypothetical protein